MANELEIVIPHKLGVEGARRRGQDASGVLKAEFGHYVSSFSEAWSGNRLDFEIKALGASAAGSAEVTADSLHITVQLPLILRPFANQIESYAAQQGPKFFAKA